VSVRYRDGKQENGMPFATFKARVLEKVASRALDI